VKDGVMEQYAIGGAVAALFYIEPINTNDLDISSCAGSKRWARYPGAAIHVPFAFGLQGKERQSRLKGGRSVPSIFNPLLEEAVEQA